MRRKGSAAALLLSYAAHVAAATAKAAANLATADFHLDVHAFAGCFQGRMHGTG